jgi:putative flippase GtrA
MQYMEQLYSLSKPGQYLSVRFTKFAIVGSIGMAVNLIAMAAIIRLFALKDWRASLMASLLATVSNYLLNNSWTFREKRRRGLQFATGYLIYLAVSLIGITLTAGVYHLLTVGLAHAMNISLAAMRSELLLLCQLVAVTAGIYSNYHLNKHGTWGDVFSGYTEPEAAPLELKTKHE